MHWCAFVFCCKQNDSHRGNYILTAGTWKIPTRGPKEVRQCHVQDCLPELCLAKNSQPASLRVIFNDNHEMESHNARCQSFINNPRHSMWQNIMKWDNQKFWCSKSSQLIAVYLQSSVSRSSSGSCSRSGSRNHSRSCCGCGRRSKRESRSASGSRTNMAKNGVNASVVSRVRHQWQQLLLWSCFTWNKLHQLVMS